MPPKRKTVARAQTSDAKKAKVDSEEPTCSKYVTNDTPGKHEETKKKIYKPDAYIPPHLRPSSTVFEDYSCMLNQTNIGQNNNKCYVIQLLQNSHAGNQYYVYTRWGRVGEEGQHAESEYTHDKAKAVRMFEEKFYQKTKWRWHNRSCFVASHGKYTFLEISDDQEEAKEPTTMASRVRSWMTDMLGWGDGKTEPCSLDKPTQELLSLIFDKEMFINTMLGLNIDVHRMPLGSLSKNQIDKGFECLERLEKELNKGRKTQLLQMSSTFYTLIPHSFGRKTPEVINSHKKLQMKFGMLEVLRDIEIAQDMQKNNENEEQRPKAPHPLDIKYGYMKCDLELLSTSSEEYKKIDQYTKATRLSWILPRIKYAWKVNRTGEEERFTNHDDITNRKLLWHGTRVAVVAAILKNGMRIMPHSGGALGKGIYFASENAKSAGYVGSPTSKAVMFLSEVALGDEFSSGVIDQSLRKAPDGFDSVVGRGRNEPDPAYDTTLVLDGKKVTVPQGKSVRQEKWKDSRFYKSEYLIYKESQCRIRYVLLMDFGLTCFANL